MANRPTISKAVVQGLLDHFSQDLASLKCPMPGTTSYWGSVLELLGDIIFLDDPDLNRAVEEFLEEWLGSEEVRKRVSLWSALKDMFVAKLKHRFWTRGITPNLEYLICKWFYRFVASEGLEKMLKALELFKKCMHIKEEALRNKAWQEVLDYLDGRSVDILILHLDLLLQNLDPSDLGTYCIADELPF